MDQGLPLVRRAHRVLSGDARDGGRTRADGLHADITLTFNLNLNPVLIMKISDNTWAVIVKVLYALAGAIAAAVGVTAANIL